MTNMVEKAFLFALEVHGKQRRKDGKPYIVHPFAVANELAKNGADDDLICGVKPFYFVGGGCEISIPISVGDFGILLACKFDISGFIEKHATADVR